MKFIEFTTAIKTTSPEKFCMNIEDITYFAEVENACKVDKIYYNNCNSTIETANSAYYVQETYEQIKDLLKNA